MDGVIVLVIDPNDARDWVRPKTHTSDVYVLIPINSYGYMLNMEVTFGTISLITNHTSVWLSLDCGPETLA